MNNGPGTYVLVLHSRANVDIEVGHWGRLRVEPGYYAYVGSAFGPGGLRARLARHFRREKKNHWHVDYLREVTEPVAAWCLHASVRLEHRWAKALGRRQGIACIAGFGSSDCCCDGHLFAMLRGHNAAAIHHVLAEACPEGSLNDVTH
ncbi:MAG: GIY-YIG nuclease family protein [Gammaproteobacteria bacterium]|jgi:Uri superfamily endonuclease